MGYRGTSVRLLKISFSIAKLALAAAWALPYVRWRIWRAKHAFKKELEKNGLSGDLVASLVKSYNQQNKNVFGLFTGGLRSLRNAERFTEGKIEGFLD